MRYWKVSLLSDGRTTREWHVRAEALTVGSNGANAVRLPPPVEPFALRLETCESPVEHPAGPFLLRVEDETAERGRVWSQAQIRIEQAKQTFVEAPMETHAPVRMAAAALALVGLTNIAASFLTEGRHDLLGEIQHRSVVAASRSPRPGYAPVASESAAVVIRTAAAQPASRLACVGPSLSLDGYGTGSGPSVASALSALDFTVPTGDGLWSSAPPSRYRAPWPDAPVPPH